MQNNVRRESRTIAGRFRGGKLAPVMAVTVVKLGEIPSLTTVNGVAVPLQETNISTDYRSDGQLTTMPEGTDVEDVLTGLMFQTWNKTKARVQRDWSAHAAGKPPRENLLLDMSLSGGPRPPPDKRVNLSFWPWAGWNPFGEAYRGTP